VNEPVLVSEVAQRQHFHHLTISLVALFEMINLDLFHALVEDFWQLHERQNEFPEGDFDQRMR
jgi:hypothetical protein